ncbi:MAG: nuclear transport factor 2 family protein [Actinomycetota bacterium]
MDTEATRDLIERYYATLTKGRRALGELLTEDCEFHPPATSTTGMVAGRDEVAALLSGKMVKESFDLSQPFELEVQRMVVDGPVAVVQQRLAATAANGNAYDNDYCWVYECRDGAVARIDEYADTLKAARIMGWLDD